MTDHSRRFTDKEVALVLRRASEMDEVEGGGGSAGLTLAELEQIAGEVGISASQIQRAVSELDRKPSVAFLGSSPRTHQAVRGVAGELDEETTARLIQHVEGSSDQVGVVTQALGGTQWTAHDRFRTTQVSVTPAKGETRVRVVERASSRLWRLTHFAPIGVGVGLVAGTVGALDPTNGLVAAAMAAGAAAGAGVGHFVWTRLSAASKARVERMAALLTREAEAKLGSDPETE